MKSHSYFEFDHWDKILSNLEDINNTCVDIGYYAEDIHESSELAMSDLATIHERGSTKNNIPARPFMTKSGDLLYGDTNILKIIGKAIVMEVGVKNAYSQIGVIGQKSIQASIDTQAFVPLKEETIRKKGGNRTILIDTKQLYNEPKFKISNDPDEKEG